MDQGEGRGWQVERYQHRSPPSKHPQAFPKDGPDLPSGRPKGTPSTASPLLWLSPHASKSVIFSPSHHCPNGQSRRGWRAKNYFPSEMSRINDSLLNNYYGSDIYTQINEMFYGSGFPGACDFIGGTGHVLKS